ncbi:thioredoxin family protein [Brevibacillus nitrificans]|uniref:thioredoxin family protein n=1 Tax=Brevibacillus nitrificans TaxID=651560 RepID=UPI002855F536|nr:thioredoxin family protein [Brevibacillus nitrificans]MDR7318341.1 thiol-disulfide isomerase/thioredoxin [Brevibacillus nitrificans]
MREYNDLSELTADIAKHPVSLLFVKMANCGVCDATFEKTKELLQSYPQVPFMVASIEKLPSLSGELLLFTAPTILLFREGKEVFRQSRIVVFGELERSLQVMIESL